MADADRPDSPDLTAEQKRWAFGAAGLFILSIGFLGYALSNGILIAFAIGWVALQIFGYVGSLKRGNGDFAHPLFKTQVMLHAAAFGLLVMVMTRALGG